MKTGKILLCVVVFGLFIGCKQQPSYSTFRGDNQHTGVYESVDIEQPALKWKCNLNGVAISSPAVIDDIAYIGSGDNHLYAIDIENGQVKWKFATQGAIHSSPAVNNEMVYFGSNDGNFYAVDKNKGTEKWIFKTQGEKQYSAINLFGFDTDSVEAADPWDFYLSSPIVEGEMVYFGSGDSYIYALNANTGELVWEYKTGNVVHSSPAISNGTVFCGSFDSKLYALDAKTGDKKWVFEAGTDEKYHLMCGIQASPMIKDGIVYSGCRDAYIYAVEAATGKLKWKQKFGSSWMPGSAAISGDRLYVGSSDAKKYYSLDAKTGAIIDSLPTNSYTFSSPAISGSTVYIGVFNGFLHAFDKNNGKMKWTFETDAGNSDFVNEDGTIKKELFEDITYKQHSDMALYLERIFSLGSIASSPVVYNNVIYFSSADGFLYAIN
ncbi:MAG: PQQ-binding-like beta-propeller repeat protein [Chloroflexia bacterium]|nr:PQQ-binding-like beta-propeller repeat protein [Chloroflexia bacterium]